MFIKRVAHILMGLFLIFFSKDGYSTPSVRVASIQLLDLSHAENSYKYLHSLDLSADIGYFQIEQEGNSKVTAFMTGSSIVTSFQSKLMASQEAKAIKFCELELPHPPTHPLIFGNNQILTGVTEFKSDLLFNEEAPEVETEKIYVASRHAIINYLNSNYINKNHLFNGKNFYQIIDSESRKYLDVIVISTSNYERIKETIGSASIINSQNQSWISKQFGSFGSQASSQCSEGQNLIQEVKPSAIKDKSNELESTGFYGLPVIEKLSSNLTSPGSSGAMVWTIGQNKSLHALGIIQCLQKQPEGSSIKSVVRVIGFDRINKGLLQEVSFDELKKSLLDEILSFPDCTPIDRAGVGADNRINIEDP